MLSKFVAFSLASLVMLAILPEVVQAQAPCVAKPPSKIIRPYFPIVYESPGCPPGGRYQRGAYAQNSTAGGVPFTVRNFIRTLDCLIPCGPRSGHGCGITCIGAGSGCLGLHCNRDIIYCPECGAPPFMCCCCGNGTAIYAPPSVLMRACHFEPCCEPEYFETGPQREIQASGY
jgi:hypothetical protein